MTSLSDAGAVVRRVPIDKDGKTATVTGITLDGVVLLLDRFPEFKAMITPKRGEIDKSEFSLESLIKMGPRIIGAVIAAGIGEAGSEKAEMMAKSLTVGFQAKLIREIMEATFPGGLGPFVEDLKAMGLLGRASTEDEQLSSQKPSDSDSGASGDTGRGPDTTSSSPPRSSGDEATPKS